jgi:SAM-dependent methyltransferase
MSDEAEAVRARYARRASNVPADRYSMLWPANWQTLQERQRAMIGLFLQLGLTDLASLDLLEVGCGAGGNLLELLRMGFAPQRLQGIELLPERVARAREMLPAAVRLHSGDATAIVVPEASQDIVVQAVVFSSLLDDAFQRRLAQDIWRWVRPGGGVLWYDFVYDNPGNSDVRGVPLRRVRELFPGAAIVKRRVTLAPPIARRVTRLHPAMYGLFNTLPLLRTHLLCWIQKP